MLGTELDFGILLPKLLGTILTNTLGIGDDLTLGTTFELSPHDKLGSLLGIKLSNTLRTSLDIILDVPLGIKLGQELENAQSNTFSNVI